MGYNVFYGCDNLTNVILGSGVSNIGKGTFANCKNLENVYCYAMNVPDADDTFAGSYIEYANLYVPDESIDAYKSANVWKDFGNIRGLSEVASVEAINRESEKEAPYYNLQGQKVATLQSGKVYINNGKKFFAK